MVQVGARTISMQFEGSWNPIVDIIVDKVGKYIYDLQSPSDSTCLPIIMDVSLEERTKVGGNCLHLQTLFCLFSSGHFFVNAHKYPHICKLHDRIDRATAGKNRT